MTKEEKGWCFTAIFLIALSAFIYLLHFNFSQPREKNAIEQEFVQEQVVKVLIAVYHPNYTEMFIVEFDSGKRVEAACVDGQFPMVGEKWKVRFNKNEHPPLELYEKDE